MFCSTPQRLAKIKSYEYEINGKKKLETTTTKKMYEVAGNPDLKRSNNKRQRMPLGHETPSDLFAHKNFAKSAFPERESYVKIYEPRYARAFSPRFVNLISTNHNLSFARRHTQSLLNHSFSCT